MQLSQRAHPRRLMIRCRHAAVLTLVLAACTPVGPTAHPTPTADAAEVEALLPSPTEEPSLSSPSESPMSYRYIDELLHPAFEWSCDERQIMFTATLDKERYALGETIEVDVRAVNEGPECTSTRRDRGSDFSVLIFPGRTELVDCGYRADRLDFLTWEAGQERSVHVAWNQRRNARSGRPCDFEGAPMAPGAYRLVAWLRPRPGGRIAIPFVIEELQQSETPGPLDGLTR